MALSPNKIRQMVLTMSFRGQSVHVPSAFSIVEVLCALYDGPLSDEKTGHRFVLSKGHGTMSLYAVLAERGDLAMKHIDNYFNDGSILHGLPEVQTPGIEASTGSLGHGLSIAAGMAKALKIQKSAAKVFCLVGDGEMNEGPIWEAMLFARQQKLDNLVVIVDVNKWQAMGRTSEVLELEDLSEKFNAFGFETKRCDGHDLNELKNKLSALVTEGQPETPKVLIADTIKGKGVSFIENDNTWHYTKLKQDTYDQAMQEVADA